MVSKSDCESKSHPTCDNDFYRNFRSHDIKPFRYFNSIVYNYDVFYILIALVGKDRLCGLVVRLPGCGPRGFGLDSRKCQIF
jgi:hypothetical protein